MTRQNKHNILATQHHELASCKGEDGSLNVTILGTLTDVDLMRTYAKVSSHGWVCVEMPTSTATELAAETATTGGAGGKVGGGTTGGATKTGRAAAALALALFEGERASCNAHMKLEIE